MDSGASLDLNALIQYGALGVIVILFVLGFIVPASALKDRDARIAALEAENSRMRQAMEEKVIPALVRATDILGKLPGRRT